MTHQDAVFDGLSFGIKYLVRSFDLKVEPGGRKGFVTPCITRACTEKSSPQGQKTGNRVKTKNIFRFIRIKPIFQAEDDENH